MTAEALYAAARTCIADVLPDAAIASLSNYDPANKAQPHLYRLRLVGRSSVYREICQMGYTPEDVLDKFEAAVRKSLTPGREDEDDPTNV